MSSTVYMAIQDSLGFIWFATQSNGNFYIPSMDVQSHYAGKDAPQESPTVVLPTDDYKQYYDYYNGKNVTESHGQKELFAYHETKQRAATTKGITFFDCHEIQRHDYILTPVFSTGINAEDSTFQLPMIYLQALRFFWFSSTGKRSNYQAPV